MAVGRVMLIQANQTPGLNFTRHGTTCSDLLNMPGIDGPHCLQPWC